MKLQWEKSSFKRYVAATNGPDICVVRSGRAALMNERWHPEVFGNCFAGPGDGFLTWAEAAEAAEGIAARYAQAVTALLGPTKATR